MMFVLTGNFLLKTSIDFANCPSHFSYLVFKALFNLSDIINLSELKKIISKCKSYTLVTVLSSVNCHSKSVG